MIEFANILSFAGGVFVGAGLMLALLVLLLFAVLYWEHNDDH
jgi:hypothetical protein